MKLHLKPTKKVLLALGAATLACVGLSGYAFQKQSQQRDAWQAQLEAKRQEADAVEAAARQLPDSERQLAGIQYKLSFLRDVEPNNYQPALLLEVATLARRSGLNLSMFNPTEGARTQQSPVARLGKTKIAPHQYLTINMGVEGSFHNVSQFLYRLTGLPKIVSVDTVQMQPLLEAPVTYVRANLQTTAYIVKEVPAQTAAAAAKLREIREAEETYKLKNEEYANLSTLRGAGLLALKEGEMLQGYTFSTDASTGKASFKVLAATKEPKLHDLSIDQSNKIMDETEKVLYE